MKKIYILLIFLSFSFNISCKKSGPLLKFENHKIQHQLEKILGNQERVVLHSSVPFELGHDAGGASDIYIYKNNLNKVFYITGDLYGKRQKLSDAGNYEFLIAHSNEDKWGPYLISRLAYNSLESSIYSGETMDLGSFALKGSSIKAIIFDKYADFTIDNNKYGLMLVMGITKDEFNWAKKNGGKELIIKLKGKNIYPYTNLTRKSIFDK